MSRQRRRRRYERARPHEEASARGPYGFTARHVRCDSCQRDYLPQHVSRTSRFGWECGNCEKEGAMMEPEPRLRWRYADNPVMLAGLELLLDLRSLQESS